MPIVMAIRKYGKDSFTMQAIEHCSTQAELNAAELHWALQLNTFSPNGYNLRAGAGPGAMAEETKAKISASNTGRQASPALKAKLSAAHKGIPMSESNRLRLKNRYRGRPVSDKGAQAASQANAKTYTLITPSGEQVVVTNMRKHCKAHNLSCSKMSEVVTSKKPQHKGWRLSTQLPL